MYNLLYRGFSTVIVLVMFSACASKPTILPLIHPTANEKTAPVLFLADPQIHNIYGMGLKQMTRISDIASKVAVRQPEINIIAPLILENLIAQSEKKNNSEAIIVLGDATNIGCSGEFNTFMESIKYGNINNVPVLLAHGNHDTYLMGTVNHYFPTSSASNWKPDFMETSNVPTDEDWWGEGVIDSRNGRNWRDGCYSPNKESSPMNKSRWLAKYISYLSGVGLKRVNIEKSIEGKKKRSVFELSYGSRMGTPLSELNFEAKGFWFPPEFKKVPQKSYFTRVYKSFLVQRAQIEETDIIIIDTSLCEKARGGFLGFAFTNAGQNACIGDSQFEVIKEYVDEVKTGRRLVVAGHFPLADLKSRERNRLLRIMSSHAGWTYMSAHSHYATKQFKWGNGSEINIASTTDWPMEASNVWFNEVSRGPIIGQINNQANILDNSDFTKYSGKSEACRHLVVAKKIAELSSYENVQWKSPKPDASCDPNKAEDWEEVGLALMEQVTIITNRFRSDEKYKEVVLSIMSTASKNEKDSWDLVELIP